jgi:hypothetical protein
LSCATLPILSLSRIYFFFALFSFLLLFSIESSLLYSARMQSDQNMQKIEVDLPLEVTGLVVGKKGVTINKVKQLSKATVVLSADPLPENEKLKRLTIQGSKREVDIALDQIVKLLNSWCGFESDSGGNQKNMDLLPGKTRDIVLTYRSRQLQPNRNAPTAQSLPPGAHNPHGAAGHIVTQHTPSSHVISDMPPPAHQFSGEVPNTYDVRNSAATNPYYPPPENNAVLNGQQQVYRAPPQNNVVNPAVAQTENPLCHRAELEVPRACVSYIVGKNFENIAHLERTSGAQIFPLEATAGENPAMIRIAFSGSEQAVYTARVSLWQVTVDFTCQRF